MLAFLVICAVANSNLLAISLILRNTLLTVISVVIFTLILLITKKKYILGLILFSLIAFVTSFKYYPLVLNPLDENYIGKDIKIVGKVIDYFDLKGDKYYFHIQAITPNSNILAVYTRSYPPAYGEIIQLNGKIFESKVNAFTLKDRYIVYVDKVDILKSNFFFRELNNLRLLIIKRTNILLKSEAGALLLSSLIGVNALENETKTFFNYTGTAHIFAISGLHIGTLFAFFVLLFKRFLKYSQILSLFLVFLFVIFIGIKFSAIRSFVMLSVVVLSYYLGRGKTILNSLFVSIALIFSIFPDSLLSISFYLSCMAMVAIALSAKVFTKNNFINTFKTSFFVNIFEIPIIAYYFNVVSITSFLVNLVVIPYIAFILPVGLLFVLISLFSIKLGALLSYIVNFLYAILIKLVEIVSKIPHGFVRLKIDTFAFILLIILLLGIYFSVSNRKYLLTVSIGMIYLFVLFSGSFSQGVYSSKIRNINAVYVQSNNVNLLFIVKQASYNSEYYDFSSFISKNAISHIDKLFIISPLDIKSGADLVDSIKRNNIKIEKVFATEDIDKEFLEINFPNYTKINSLSYKMQGFEIVYKNNFLEIKFENGFSY